MNEHLLTWVALDEGPDESSRRSVVQLMPAGTFRHRMAGPKPFTITEENLTTYAEEINSHGDRISVDYDHSFAKGRGSKAAGWFVPGSAKVEDGHLVAEIEWTPPAADAIRNGEYRFLSPEFDFKRAGGSALKIVAERLKAAALTNRPYFDDMQPVMLAEKGLDELLAVEDFLIESAQLEAANARWGEEVTRALIASAQSPGDAAQLAKSILSSIQPEKEILMPDEVNLTPLAEAVGITAEDPSVDDIATAFRSVADENETLKAKVTELESKLPNDDAMKSLLASAQKGEEAANKLAALEKTTLLDEAVRARKIVPAARGTFESMFDIDPEGTTKLLAEMQEGSFAALGSGEAEGEFGPATTTMVAAGEELPVDSQSSQIHEGAIKILAEAGKGASYTADEYFAAAEQAMAKLGK